MKAAKLHGVKNIEFGSVKIQFDSELPSEQNKHIKEQKLTSEYMPTEFEIDSTDLSEDEKQLMMIADSDEYEREFLYDETKETTFVHTASQAF